MVEGSVDVGLAAPPAKGAGGEGHVSVGRVLVTNAPVEILLGHLGTRRRVSTLK